MNVSRLTHNETDCIYVCEMYGCVLAMPMGLQFYTGLLFSHFHLVRLFCGVVLFMRSDVLFCSRFMCVAWWLCCDFKAEHSENKFCTFFGLSDRIIIGGVRSKQVYLCNAIDTLKSKCYCQIKREMKKENGKMARLHIHKMLAGRSKWNWVWQKKGGWQTSRSSQLLFKH